MPSLNVLSEKEIKKRLAKDLLITPILDPCYQIEDCSVNLRLGTKIVLPRLSEHTCIDPRELSDDAAIGFQRMRLLSFGEQFILHPRSLILALTYEFVALPRDICGYVLSRSSYGRLGLVVATATFVHPNWKGCLTLELVNQGELPISLHPLDPVAQLVLQNCEKVPKKKLTDVPLEPQFRKALNKDDLKKLEHIENLIKHESPPK
jgi:dCTP deaminase